MFDYIHLCKTNCLYSCSLFVLFWIYYLGNLVSLASGSTFSDYMVSAPFQGGGGVGGCSVQYLNIFHREKKQTMLWCCTFVQLLTYNMHKVFVSILWNYVRQPLQQHYCAPYSRLWGKRLLRRCATHQRGKTTRKQTMPPGHTIQRGKELGWAAKGWGMRHPTFD